MRELIKKRRFTEKKRIFVSILLFLLLLAVVAVLALSCEKKEKDGDDLADEMAGDLADETEEDFSSDEEYEEEPLGWDFPPPRWFRSNAGGMALEEIPSRLAALRNEYALVIDYLTLDELDPFLAPFFNDEYTIEIRVLYKQRSESRRQWLFRDEMGNVRLNAVFRFKEPEPTPEGPGGTEGSEGENILALVSELTPEPDPEQADDSVVVEKKETDEDKEVGDAEESNGAGEPPEPAINSVQIAAFPIGFIEIFNENGKIINNHWFTEDGDEILTSYFYNENLLIKSETQNKKSGEKNYTKIYTDNYRYNRSFYLRNVIRFYHESTDEPMRLTFPGRVLDAAADSNFLSDKLSLSSDFLGTSSADEGFRMEYETDSRGRILSQAMFDDNDELVWVVKNTWSGERITAVLKIEGEVEKLTEYEYDNDGKRIIQRDIQNGVLERLVRTDGSKETEELYMNGVVVLRAFWEDGRKISEERVRR